MARYKVTLYDGFDRELHRTVVSAQNLRLALVVAEAVLDNHPAGLRLDREAVSASVDLVPVFDQDAPGAAMDAVLACLPGDVDESAGQAELHSVRADLHVGGRDYVIDSEGRPRDVYTGDLLDL